MIIRNFEYLLDDGSKFKYFIDDKQQIWIPL